MFDAKVATTILFLFAFLNKFSKLSPTDFSLGVYPGLSALVESDKRANTPLRPYSANLLKSIISPSTGVVSILKSPVWIITPAGQRIARPTASGIE